MQQQQVWEPPEGCLTLPGKQGDERWRKARLLTMRATRAAAASGLGTYDTPGECAVKLWSAWDAGRDPDPPDPYGDIAEGHLQEGPNARRCLELMGYSTMQEDCPAYCDARRRHLTVSPDRILLDPEAYGVPIECKNSLTYLPRVPKTEHVVQVIQQLYVMRAPYGLLTYRHSPTLSTRVFRVRHCAPLWEWILERLEYFYRRVVLEREPPVDVLPLGKLIEQWWERGYPPLPEQLRGLPERWDHGRTGVLPPCPPRWELVLEDLHGKWR